MDLAELGHWVGAGCAELEAGSARPQEWGSKLPKLSICGGYRIEHGWQGQSSRLGQMAKSLKVRLKTVAFV